MTQVLAPLPGRVCTVGEVPDKVFADQIVGPGAAIDPLREPGTVVAPAAGRLLKLHPHAFAMLTPDGTGLLVHLGIDTVQLSGEGFELLVDERSTVAAGDPIVRWSPADVEAGGRSPIVPVIVLDAPKDSVDLQRVGQQVASGDLLFTWPAP